MKKRLMTETNSGAKADTRFRKSPTTHSKSSAGIPANENTNLKFKSRISTSQVSNWKECPIGVQKLLECKIGVLKQKECEIGVRKQKECEIELRKQKEDEIEVQKWNECEIKVQQLKDCEVVQNQKEYENSRMAFNIFSITGGANGDVDDDFWFSDEDEDEEQFDDEDDENAV